MIATAPTDRPTINPMSKSQFAAEFNLYPVIQVVQLYENESPLKAKVQDEQP